MFRNDAVEGRPRRRRPGLGVLVVGGVAVVALGAWLAGSQVRSPQQAAANAAPPPRTLLTAPVELRPLTSTVIGRGDVTPAVSTPVVGPRAGSSAGDVVTGLFVRQGADVVEGDRIMEVSGRPVFVLEGSTPAYRTMRPGMHGADVGQLQAALTRAGCDAGESGLYDEATKHCVENLYTSAGYDIVAASSSELADLATARDAVATAEGQLADAHVALAEATAPPPAADLVAARTGVAAAQRNVDDTVADGRSSVAAARRVLDEQLAVLNVALATAAGIGERESDARHVADALARVDDAQRQADSADAAAAESLDIARAVLADLQAPANATVEEVAVDRAESAVARAHEDLEALEAVSGPVVPFGEVVFVAELPAVVDTLNVNVGDDLNASTDAEPQPQTTGPTPPVVLASGGLSVRTLLSTDDVQLLQVGMEGLLLDESSGTELPAEVTAIDDQASSNSSGTQGFEVELMGREPVPLAWSGRNIRVTFTTAATDSDVLVVPVAAMSTGADGQERVELAGPDGQSSVVPVSAGLTVDGFVEVTPINDGTLVEGDNVVIGR